VRAPVRPHPAGATAVTVDPGLDIAARSRAKQLLFSPKVPVAATAPAAPDTLIVASAICLRLVAVYGGSMSRPGLRPVIAIAWLLSLAGCELLDEPRRSLGAAPPDCHFPANVEIGFAAQSSLAELRLSNDRGDELRGHIYVTAHKIVMWNEPPPQRYFCFIAPPDADFKSVIGLVPAGWAPP
jgi:hypothetical protein